MRYLLITLLFVMTVGQLAEAQHRGDRRGDRRGDSRRRDEPQYRPRAVPRPPPEYRPPVVRPPYGYYRPGWDPRVYQTRPHWWVGIWANRYPFSWSIGVYPGYYQCTAFNNQGIPFTGVSRDYGQAFYNAVLQCEASPWGPYGCYVPPGYCQLR